MKRIVVLLTLIAAACGQPPQDDQTGTSPPANAQAAPAPPADPPRPEQPPVASVLTLIGLGDIVIGAPPRMTGPGALTEDHVQLSAECRTLSSPEHPDVYVMTDGKLVTRITLMRDTKVRTEKGIVPGASEAEVRAAYSPLAERGHDYGAAPAKNLVWGGKGGKPGLRFEIGNDGRVTMVHAGVQPMLGYSEGCA